LAADERRDGRLVVVGEVMGAIGTAGQLRVKVHNPESDLLPEAQSLIVVHADSEREVRVLESAHHGKGLRMRLAGVDGREAARALFGAQLCVPRESLPALADDEFYVVDLVGARAYLDDGTEVGEVTRYLPYPGADVLQIETATGPLELPLFEPYLQAVDVEGGRITVAFLDDLRGGDKP